MQHTCTATLSTARRPKRIAAALTITASLLLPSAAARGQSFPWGWGQPAKPSANWSPELFADYLLTGQTPHPAVARIVAPEHSGVSLGSGVLVDANRTQGLVLTNWHVIRDSRSAVLVQFPDGFQSAGTVIRWDEAWDLAALVVWRPNATPLPLAQQPPAIGEPLTIAGYGRGTFRAQSGPCTEYLSPGTGYAKEFVELAATARQGDSGGPILNERGELAGVLFGQNDGRTIGSCSTRVRTFLAGVGSRGFTPTPQAEFSPTLAVDRGIGAAAPVPARLASATSDDAMQRSMHVAGTGGFPAPPPEAWNQPVAAMAAGVQPPFAAPAPGMPPPTLAELLDVSTNGHAMLSAAGGLAMAVLGIRTIFGGRRRVTSEPSS